MRSLQPPDILWIHWRVYNSIANTSKGGTLLPPSDACQKLSLSPLYFNKTLLHKSSERSSLLSVPGLNSSPPEAKNPASHRSATTFQFLVHSVGFDKCMMTYSHYYSININIALILIFSLL